MLEKKHILIVDDDPDQRLGLRIRLRANHFSTAFAGDGATSIAEAQAHQPDLIILDLGLPGDDGFAVMGRLKKMPQLSAIPVIVVSARANDFNRERALQEGAEAYLRKPVDNDELLAVIHRALNRQNA